MFLDYFHILAGGLAVFLIGANIAFLLHLGENIFSWFQFKILAVTALLIYVAISLMISGPGAGRTTIAAVALVVDTIALYRLWANVVEVTGGQIRVTKEVSVDHNDE